MAEISDVLGDFNPWWKKKFELSYKKRAIYEQIQKFMSLRPIIALTGLRRVGKTTLLLKVVQDAIDKGFDPRGIVYFSFDEFRGAKIREILRVYERIMERDLESGSVLFLLDEIQKLEGWGNQLKAIYDAFPSIKILISGSESLFIKKESSETLAGRIFEFRVEPLSFREYLLFRDVPFSPPALYQKELRMLFEEFTLTLGFPELVGLREKDVIRKYVRESIVEKVIYRDLASLFRIREIAIIETLLNIFMEEPGQIVELNQLAGDLKISRQTLSNYLLYLEKSFLIRKLYNFAKSRRKVERKLKKYYPAIVSVDLLFRDDDFQRSKVFECFIVNQLKAEFFWRDPYKNEVDIVSGDREPVPVEIKYGKIETRGLLAFMRKFRVRQGFIISRDKEQTLKRDEKTISVLPAHQFLLK
jgi:predicted AAA+ superfamily ATPase